MTTDRELLESYARERSESAFAELVARHINVVYAAALRETRGDTGLAEDITQSVFSELARKASRLRQHPALAGWLYTCVRHVAANIRRSEVRRQRREQEAHTMKELLSPDTSDAAWREIQPVLDDAMHELTETDRAAVVLRFFEDRSHKEVGRALGLEESAARMRVERALEKLRTLLGKRGITSTASGLTAALAAGAAMSAPSGLAAGITTTALAGATAGGGTTLTILKIMGMTKFQAGLVSAVVVAGLSGTLLVEQQARANLRAVDGQLQQQGDQIAGLQAENSRLAAIAAQGPRSGLNNADDLSRLRSEAATLRQQTNELAKLREENRRLATSQPRTTPTQPQASLLETMEFNAVAAARMGVLKQWGLAAISAALENHNEVTTNLDLVMAQLPGAAYRTDTNFSTDLFELVYQGSINNNKTDPSQTILLREKQARKTPDGKWAKIYVFLDGSALSHREPDGNFEAYEKQLTGPEANR